MGALNEKTGDTIDTVTAADVSPQVRPSQKASSLAQTDTIAEGKL